LVLRGRSTTFTPNWQTQRIPYVLARGCRLVRIATSTLHIRTLGP
jgi:hypothetical protein